MLEYFIVPSKVFDTWNSPLKARYPSPTRSPADNGSEVLLTLYQGPLALTQVHIDKIEDIGGVRMDQETLKAYQAAHPEKWKADEMYAEET